MGDEWPSFTSSKQSDYVILDENSRIENKFRFCEMGLWGGIPDILQSSFCNFPGISNILNTVPDLLTNGVLGNVTEGTVNILGNPIKALEGLLGKKENKKPSTSSTSTSSTSTRKPTLLGGILG